MKSLLILDETGCDEKAQAILLDSGVEAEKMDFTPRIWVGLTLVGDGLKKIPTLVFNNETEELNFFALFEDRSKKSLCFTTIKSFGDFQNFNGLIFKNSNRTLSISFADVEESLSRINQRLFTIKAHESHHHDFTLGIVSYKDKLTSDVIFPLYYDVRDVHVSAKNIEKLYANFAQRKSDFPFMLAPVEMEDNTNSYYNTNYQNLRKALNHIILTYCQQLGGSGYDLTNSVAYKLWLLTDLSIFQEYLKIGGYFELSNQHLEYKTGSYNHFSYFDAEGQTKIMLKCVADGSVMSQWLNDMFMANEDNQSDALSHLLDCLKSDLSSPFDNFLIEAQATKDVDQDNSQHSWFKIDAGMFNDRMPSQHEGGFYSILSRFRDSNYMDGAPELKAFITKRILEVAKRTVRDKNAVDHNYALTLLGEHLWNVPLKVISDPDGGLNQSLIKQVQRMVLIEWVEAITSQIQWDFSQVSLSGTICYLDYVSEQNVLKTRMLLPGGALLVYNNTCRLDDDNARLDFNFILN